MNTFKLFIFAADRPFFAGSCESLILPTVSGQYGIMAHHRNMISAIVPGKMIYRIPGAENKTAAVSSGLVKVEDNQVLVLVDSVLRPEEIDEERARRAEEAAKEEMLQKKSMQEYHQLQADLARAMARLKVKNSDNEI